MFASQTLLSSVAIGPQSGGSVASVAGWSPTSEGGLLQVRRHGPRAAVLEARLPHPRPGRHVPQLRCVPPRHCGLSRRRTDGQCAVLVRQEAFRSRTTLVTGRPLRRAVQPTFTQLLHRRQRKERAERFAALHNAALRVWAPWWDSSPDTEQDGAWAGFARDLVRHPLKGAPF